MFGSAKLDTGSDEDDDDLVTPQPVFDKNTVIHEDEQYIVVTDAEGKAWHIDVNEGTGKPIIFYKG